MDEARFVLNKIKEIYKKTNKYSNISVFYRTNAQSRFFEEALRENNVPYKIYGGFRFYDRAEIKDMMAYLTILINPDDTGSLLRIINFPPRGLGETSIEKLRLNALERNVSLFEILKNGSTDLRKSAKLSIDNFISNYNDIVNLLNSNTKPSAIAKSLVVQMGIEDELKKNSDPESLDRLENIEQFIESIQEYEESTENPTLSEYLNMISLYTSEEDGEEITDYITLMTVHNSKGLEFETVFLTGMEEGTFPHFMSLEEKLGIEEERRLCYVAITRAKKDLYISHCQYSRKYGEIQKRDPSRFLGEIPENLFQTSSEISYRTPIRPPLSGEKKVVEKSNSQANSINIGEFKVGSKVKHREYGIGKIVDLSGIGDNRKAKIRFGYTEKNFLLVYTPLELVEK